MNGKCQSFPKNKLEWDDLCVASRRVVLSRLEFQWNLSNWQRTVDQRHPRANAKYSEVFSSSNKNKQSGISQFGELPSICIGKCPRNDMLFCLPIKRQLESDKNDVRVIKQIENEFNKLFVWHFIALRTKRFSTRSLSFRVKISCGFYGISSDRKATREKRIPIT